MSWLRLLLPCVMWLVWGSPALAHTVVLLKPPSRSPATTELLERLRGELLSVGFEVVVRTRPESNSEAERPQPWQTTLADEERCDAAVDVVGDSLPLAVDVWIVDSRHDMQLLARVKSDANSENNAKGLAIRASEVLRARLFETHAGKSKQRPSEPAPSSRAQNVEVESAGSQQSGSLGFELGAAAWLSLDGVGPALSPLLRFDWALESKLLLQATLSGFGTRPSVTTTAGSAQVATQYGLLGACYRVDWQHRVRPHAALSLGALHTAVVGQADLPRQGHTVDQWSFLFDASIGATLQLSQRYSLALAGHAQLAEPQVVIRFGEQRVASLGRPNLLVSLTFGVWP